MIKRSKSEIMDSYVKLVDFLADFLGEDYEIVLHDVLNPEKSIVYIRNNYSGRNIGGSITDLGLKILKEKKYLKENYYVNYTSKTRNGRILRSATYFINDDEGKLIAMLCINIDVTKVKFLKDYLEKLIKGEKITNVSEVLSDHAEKNNSEISEILSDSVEDIASQMMYDVISKYSIPVERMTLEEKKEIISELDKKGFFLIKGSVKGISNELDISETTVYRIINSY